MSLSQSRHDIESIFQHALREVDPERLVRNAIVVVGNELMVSGVRHELNPRGRLVLLGVGKSAVAMARGAEAALGERLDHGLVVTKSGLAGDQTRLRRTEVLEASHPIPDESSLIAGNRLLEEATGLTNDDVAIVLVSGGGSSLVEAPVDGISLGELRTTTSLLLNAGADIWTLNCVRRRLSRIKAGGLVRAIAPARAVNVILSDVLGNPVGVIASGLSVYSDQDEDWCLASLKSSAGWHELPSNVRQRLGMRVAGKPQTKSNVTQTVVVGDATLAARASAAAAAQLGYRPFLLGVDFAGDARAFGRFWAQLAYSVSSGASTIQTPACIIGAGEMTVAVHGDGKGGRNTEMAVSAALEIDGKEGIAIASLATDGDDGSSQAAGGVVDGETMSVLRGLGLDPRESLTRNDTGALLEASGNLIVTGQTGTNVNDLYIALIGDPERT